LSARKDASLPDTAACETGWRAFRIQGVLDFSLIGILSKISAILADNGIGIFAVSPITRTISSQRPDSSISRWNCCGERGIPYCKINLPSGTEIC
jgi:hypothetical protein